MKLYWILIIAAVGGLILIIVITMSYAAGTVSFSNYTTLLLAGTLLWFAGILTSNLVKRNIPDSDE